MTTNFFFPSKVIRYLGVLYVACSLDFKLCSITYVWFLYLTKFLNSNQDYKKNRESNKNKREYSSLKTFQHYLLDYIV